MENIISGHFEMLKIWRKLVLTIYAHFLKFQLKKRVKQTKTVKWLKLDQKVQEPKAGSKCLVAGWGATRRDKPSNVLMSVNVTVFDRVKCNSPEYYNFKPVITNSMICAGSDSGKPTDTCEVMTPHAGSKQPWRQILFFIVQYLWMARAHTLSRGILEARCCAMEHWWVSRPSGATAVTWRSPACIPSSPKNSSTGSRRPWRRRRKCCNNFSFRYSVLCLPATHIYPHPAGL